MANQAEKLDQVFRDKLGQHSIQPSKLAWERLESELPHKEKKPKPFWWAAAAIVLLSAIGYSFFYNPGIVEQQEFVAEEISFPSEKPEERITSNQETKSESNTKIETQKEELKNTPVQTKPSLKKASDTPSQVTLAALTEVEKEITTDEPSKSEKEMPITTTDRSFIAEIAIDLPESTLVKEEKEVYKTEEQPAYRITILSDGLKEEKEGKLIAGLGKTVNQVEGILGKVDQGFGDLQDAKNNLFASLISKKERVAEKPQ